MSHNPSLLIQAHYIYLNERFPDYIRDYTQLPHENNRHIATVLSKPNELKRKTLSVRTYIEHEGSREEPVITIKHYLKDADNG